MHPVEFPSQFDVLGGTLCGVKGDKVKYMYFHVLQTLVSISVEMSGHFGFLHIMHYQVEVPLEYLFQTVLGLANILFFASSAGYAIDQVVAVACHVVFRTVFYASNGCHDVAFRVEERAITALVVGACRVDRFSWFAILRNAVQL